MRKRIVYLLLTVLAIHCKEKYTPTLKLAAGSFLVVEGFINNGTGPTTITLSRTTKLSDTATIIPENGALVRVEAENGTNFPLSAIGSGKYTIAQLSLNSGTRYRVYIKTKDGKEYASDYSDARKTPDMDSVGWKPKDGGIQVYVNTHDPLNKTKYYQWKYNQTWEFHSKYINTLSITWDSFSAPGTPKPRITGVSFKDPTRPGIADSSMLICWKSDSLTSITIGSSERLAQDVVHEQNLAYIPPNSQQLSVRYSIIVYQYALSEKAYRFYQQLKKNTEQMGTTFDSQPSDNTGNLHCLTNPTEIAIGFIEVSEEKRKRIFINAAQVPQWNYQPNCGPEVKVRNDSDYTRSPSPIRSHVSIDLPTTVAEWGGASGIDYVYFADKFCVDCTLSGSNKKPFFWP
jgi:hypothetical protein